MIGCRAGREMLEESMVLRRDEVRKDAGGGLRGALLGVAALAIGAVALAGCGAPQEPPDEGILKFATKPASTDSAPPPATPEKKDDEGSLSKEQKEQLEIALRRGGSKVADCASVIPDAAGGEGEVTVVFDGTKGRCTDVNVGNPWAGTPAEACIKRAFIGEIVVPFDGSLEVPYTIKIPKKGAPADDKTKGKNPPKKK